MLYIHEKFLVYNLETFKNCKEVKNIMITIIAIIYIIFYVIFYPLFANIERGGEETMAYGFLMNSEKIAIN